ncbi:MAG: hypothetical protein QNJ41_00835 [Xenococcaceae cyanobacterium MO_188.B32]|nr:hypothetical protein [Xenococcaceae cyanobacterium MO_188.B32]
MEIISRSILDSQYLQISLDFYHHSISPLVTILAQVIEDPDVLGQMQDAWNNFIETGQVWALLIGMFFGYLFKSLTNY